MAQYIILKTTWQQKRTLLRIKSSRAPKNKLASFYLFTKTNIYLIYPLEIDTCNVVLSFKKKNDVIYLQWTNLAIISCRRSLHVNLLVIFNAFLGFILNQVKFELTCYLIGMSSRLPFLIKYL